MTAIVHKLDLKTSCETNLFLRALWSCLRAEYKQLGWQFTPRRFGTERKIRFGWMSLGASAPTGVEVSIFYKKVGVVSEIEFVLKDGIELVHPDIINTLNQSVSAARQLTHKPGKGTLYCMVSSEPSVPLDFYVGQYWSSTPLDNGLTRIGILLEGYDDADLRHEFAYRSDQLLDALSCMTNVSFKKVPWADDITACQSGTTNRYFNDAEWLDDYPILDKRLCLLEYEVDYLDKLLSGCLNEPDLVRAAHIFHRAVPLYRNLSEYDDVAVALFCSALETLSLSLKKSEKCSSCGQAQYSISQRINDLVDSHIGGGIPRIVKQAYGSRSLYLHTGQTKISRKATEHIIPQLDRDGIEGCAAMQNGVQTNVLMESTSYIFRRLIWITLTERV